MVRHSRRRPSGRRADPGYRPPAQQRPDAMALQSRLGWVAQGVDVIHRPLRLIMAAAITGAGLCLVLAMITLVVAIGSGGPAAVATAGYGTARRGAPEHVWRPTGHDPGSSAAAEGRQPGSVIAAYRGTGPARRGGFLVPAPGVWGLLWSFSCRSGRGTFAVTEAGTGQALVVRAAGPVGRGLLWDTHDAGHQGLVIRTACSWAVKVVLPR